MTEVRAALRAGRVLAPLALVLVIWPIFFWLFAEAYVPDVADEPVRINVRWAEAVSAEERSTYESELGLTDPEYREQATWGYSVPRPSRRTLRRIVRHDRIEDTHGIDRSSFLAQEYPLPTLWLMARALAASALLVVALGGVWLWRSRGAPALWTAAAGLTGQARDRLRRGQAALRERVSGLGRSRRTELMFLASFVALFALSLLLLSQVRPAPEPPDVRIRWTPETTEAQRLDVEREHDLAAGQLDEGRTWVYEARDWSTRNIRALLTSPHLEDTHGIDRVTGAVDDAPEVRLPFAAALVMSLGIGGTLAAGSWFVRRVGSRKSRDVLAVALILGCTAGLLLQTAALPNDLFMHLSLAARVLEGEVSQIDFVDLGAPLHVYLSAASQWLGGPTLLSEVVLSVGAIAVGVTTAAWLAKQLGAPWLLVIAAALTALSFDFRLYGYPKVLLYPIGIWLIWRFLADPRRSTAAAMGVIVAVAFLFRHDHGIYLGAASVAALAVAWWRARDAEWRAWLLAFGATGFVLTAPYLLYVHAHLGLGLYLKSGLQFSDREVRRTYLQALPQFELDWTEPWIVRLPSEGPPPPAVSVRWSAETSRAERLELEETFSLVNGTRMPEPLGATGARAATWRYRLADSSARNALELSTHPRVVDTHGIDEATGSITSTARDPLLTRLQRRFAVLRIRVLPGLIRPANILPWFYYLIWGVTLAGIGIAGARVWRAEEGDRQSDRVLLLGLVCLLINMGFLRSGLEHRLADVVIPATIMGVWLAHEGLTGKGRASRYQRALTVCVLGITALCVMARFVASERVEIVERPAATYRATASRVVAWGASRPIDLWAPPASEGLEGLTRYVYECTGRSDKWLVSWFAPQVFYYSERGFAGGQNVYGVGILTAAEWRPRRMRMLARESVPIIAIRDRDNDFFNEYPVLAQWVRENYEVATTTMTDGGQVNVLLRNDWQPSGQPGWRGLPCAESAVSLSLGPQGAAEPGQ